MVILFLLTCALLVISIMMDQKSKSRIWAYICILSILGLVGEILYSAWTIIENVIIYLT